MSKVKNLKGTGIGISHDYPKEIDVIHETVPSTKEGQTRDPVCFFQSG